MLPRLLLSHPSPFSSTSVNKPSATAVLRAKHVRMYFHQRAMKCSAVTGCTLSWHHRPCPTHIDACAVADISALLLKD